MTDAIAPCPGCGHEEHAGFCDCGCLDDRSHAVKERERRARTDLDLEAAELVEDEITEHVSDIMFDSLSRPDPDCTLCKAGIALGAWAAYGVTDPFSPEEDE